MEFPHIGVHCALPECKQLDFLPFECDACHLKFCLEHKDYAAHHCTAPPPREDVRVPACPLCGQAVPVGEREDVNRKINAHIESGCPSVPKKHANPCSFPGCTKGELTPIVCKGCGKNFCLSHRFEDNHACVGRGRGRPAPAVATSSQPRTQAILAAAKAKPKSATTHGFATTKRNPEGDRRIRPEDRVMLAIQFSPGTGLPGRHMFFNAEWTVGRVIDAIAESTKGAIRNNNNVVPDEQKLHLFVKKTGRMLPMDRKLKDLTGDPATKPPLKAGDMVMLQRGLTLEIPRKEDKCTTS